jgi:NADPH2:quinone reductase
VKRVVVRTFGGPEVLELEEANAPRPGAGEVLVRVRAVGVNPYDTYMRAGASGARNPPLPFTPGSDGAGTVEAFGSDVHDRDDPCFGLNGYVLTVPSGFGAEGQ